MSRQLGFVLIAILTIGLLIDRSSRERPSRCRPIRRSSPGELDNGLKYIVRKHAVPPGRAVMWIHIHTGSLNETDRQRGIAHYLEHMAFNGSENFSPARSCRSSSRWA